MTVGPEIVYLLCLLASVGCALLLTQAWRRTRAALMLWSALCFGFLAANSFVVVVDLLIIPEGDLSLIRYALSLAGVSLLLFGFIWEVRP